MPDRGRPRPILSAELRVEAEITQTDGELDDRSDLPPSRCKITYRPFPRGERSQVSPWVERDLHHQDMEAWREKRGIPLRGPLPTHSFHYPPPGSPRVRDNSLPPERRTWQTEE
eukprot:5887148-Alexandrium_andersonii.AAC.1